MGLWSCLLLTYPDLSIRSAWLLTKYIKIFQYGYIFNQRVFSSNFCLCSQLLDCCMHFMKTEVLLSTEVKTEPPVCMKVNSFLSADSIFINKNNSEQNACICHFSNFPNTVRTYWPLSVSQWTGSMFILEVGLIAFCKQFKTVMPQIQLPAFFLIDWHTSGC